MITIEKKETASTSTSSQALGMTLPLHAACSRAGKTGWAGEKRKIGWKKLLSPSPSSLPSFFLSLRCLFRATFQRRSLNFKRKALGMYEFSTILATLNNSSRGHHTWFFFFFVLKMNRIKLSYWAQESTEYIGFKPLLHCAPASTNNGTRWRVDGQFHKNYRDFSLTPILDSSQTRISASSRLRKLCKRPRLTQGYTDKPKSNPRTHSEYKRSWNKITKRVKKRFKFEAPRPPRAGTTTKKIKNKNYIHQ